MHKNAKTNSIRRNSRVAKKKPVIERGLGNRFSDAYRWLKLSMLVYDNFDYLKSLFENIFF